MTSGPRWTGPLLDRLTAQTAWGYRQDGPAASEPAAWAAMACLAYGRADRAAQGLAWLAKVQSADGGVGPTETEATPCWFTSLATLAWTISHRHDRHDRYAPHIRRAVAWSLGSRGKNMPRVPEMGHDTTIPGWAWVDDTHCWIEPTALHVLALKAAGHGHDARTRDGVRMLVDRLLPDGGCNYGNTLVLGQALRPHVQPTGITLLALAGDPIHDDRIDKSLDYLAGELSAAMATASLCYGLMGLAAHGRLPEQAGDWLEVASRRSLARDPSALKLSLLALAALGEDCPILPRKSLSLSGRESG